MAPSPWSRVFTARGGTVREGMVLVLESGQGTRTYLSALGVRPMRRCPAVSRHQEQPPRSSGRWTAVSGSRSVVQASIAMTRAGSIHPRPRARIAWRSHPRTPGWPGRVRLPRVIRISLRKGVLWQYATAGTWGDVARLREVRVSNAAGFPKPPRLRSRSMMSVWWYLSPTRSRLFAALPEIELPRRFRRSVAHEWVGRIPSQRLRTIAARRLDEVLARGTTRGRKL